MFKDRINKLIDNQIEINNKKIELLNSTIVGKLTLVVNNTTQVIFLNSDDLFSIVKNLREENKQLIILKEENNDKKIKVPTKTTWFY